MADRTGQALSGAASGGAVGLGLAATGIGAPLGIPLWALGAGAGLLGGLFSKSDEEIRQERIRDYIKRLTEMKAKSLARLGEEAKKNFGRINQRTTGLIQRGQGDIARRAAGSGRTADEADFLALQGQITGQGSEAIQNTQDVYERMQRQIEDQYDQDIAGAEFEYTNIPSEPNFVDVLEGVAPAALQYTFNQQYLNNQPNTMGVPSVGVNTKSAIGAPTIYDAPPVFEGTNKKQDVIYSPPMNQKQLMPWEIDLPEDYNLDNNRRMSSNLYRRAGLFGSRYRQPSLG